MYASRKYKAKAYETAAEVWNAIDQENPKLSAEQRVKLAKQRVQETLERREKQTRRRGGFGNLFASLILSILLRLAFRWIEKWAEEKHFAVRSKYDGESA